MYWERKEKQNDLKNCIISQTNFSDKLCISGAFGDYADYRNVKNQTASETGNSSYPLVFTSW